LTRIVPFELADAVLDETRTRQRRLRLLPSRVGIYFVLALGLFPQVGYLGQLNLRDARQASGLGRYRTRPGQRAQFVGHAGHDAACRGRWQPRAGGRALSAAAARFLAIRSPVAGRKRSMGSAR
jgi:hypothetical protein